MAIVNFNTTPLKGTAGEMQLDKTNLAALTSVTNHTYFSNISNWKKVTLYYKSTVGNQKLAIKFTATDTTPLANFLASTTARDKFEVKFIIIEDFDDGYMRVERSELVVTEFDVCFGNCDEFSWKWSDAHIPPIAFDPAPATPTTWLDYTLSVWYKFDTTVIPAIPHSMIMGGSTGGTSCNHIGMTGTDNPLGFGKVTIIDATSWNNIDMDTLTDISDGAWHHITYVRDGLNHRCYVDNVKVLDRLMSVDLTNTSGLNEWCHGQPWPGNSWNTRGSTSQADWYSTAFNDSEIAELYNGGQVLYPSQHSTKSGEIRASISMGDGLGDYIDPQYSGATVIYESVRGSLIPVQTPNGWPTIDDTP